MYIACPECDTKFVVTPEQIGQYGRKVKCSKCNHIWHQKLDNPVRVEPVLTPPTASISFGNGVNLPALLPVKIPPYLYALPIVMIGLIIFMLVMLFPNSFGFNTLVNNNSLSIKDLQIENHKELEKITVSYKVHNAANKTVKMPLVRIRLFDKNSRVIKSLIDDHTNIDMSPDQFIQVKTEFVPAPPSADSIDIMLGNKIDFILK
ncbi:MAG: zinc-ribbon domain-containing protein [Rickettsiaceae bacterium]